MVVKHNEKNLDVSPVIGFDEFAENSHTGPALARGFSDALLMYKLTMADSVTLPTLDGASNNKNAFKHLKKKMKVKLHPSI